MKRIASLCLALLLALSLAAPVSAADKTTGTKMSLEEFDGTVTVRDAAGKDKTARADMRLYNGYTIATGKASSAYINLDDTAAVKLDRGTKVEIRTLGKQLDVHLLSGQLFFDTKVPRKADQSYTISTSTTVTGVRGSFGWVNLKQMGMVHGHSTVTYVDEETGKTVTIPITSGEGLSRNEDGGAAVSGNAGTFEKTVLTVADIPAIVAEAIAADPQKQAQVDEVANLDTQEIVDSVDEKKEAEAQAEEKAEKTAEEAAGQQQEEIKQLDAEDKAAGEETKVKLDADKKAEEEAKAREEAREERIREREETTEPPVQPSEPSQPSTPAGSSKEVASATADELQAWFEEVDGITITGGGECNGYYVPQGKTLTFTTKAVTLGHDTFVYGELTTTVDIVNTGNLMNKGKITATTFENHGQFDNSNIFSADMVINNNVCTIKNYGTFTATKFQNAGAFYNYSGSCNATFAPLGNLDQQPYTYELTLSGINGDASKSVTLMANTPNSKAVFDVAAYTTSNTAQKAFANWSYPADSNVSVDGNQLQLYVQKPETLTGTKVTAACTAVWQDTATVTVSAPNGATVELWRDGGLISATSTNVYQLVIGKTVTLKVYNLTTQSNQQVIAVLVPTGAATTDPTSLNKDNSDSENAYYYCDLTVPNVADQTSYTLTITEAISSGG